MYECMCISVCVCVFVDMSVFVRRLHPINNHMKIFFGHVNDVQLFSFF